MGTTAPPFLTSTLAATEWSVHAPAPLGTLWETEEALSLPGIES
jgi:hypothetical protein